MKASLAQMALSLGSSSPRLRNVLACPGTVSCSRSLVDSRALALELGRLFEGRDYPVKIKMAERADLDDAICRRNEHGESVALAHLEQLSYCIPPLGRSALGGSAREGMSSCSELKSPTRRVFQS